MLALVRIAVLDVGVEVALAGRGGHGNEKGRRQQQAVVEEVVVLLIE